MKAASEMSPDRRVEPSRAEAGFRSSGVPQTIERDDRVGAVFRCAHRRLLRAADALVHCGGHGLVDGEQPRRACHMPGTATRRRRARRRETAKRRGRRPEPVVSRAEPISSNAWSVSCGGKFERHEQRHFRSGGNGHAVATSTPSSRSSSNTARVMCSIVETPIPCGLWRATYRVSSRSCCTNASALLAAPRTGDRGHIAGLTGSTRSVSP